MTRRQRTVLLAFFVVIFIVAGASITLYAEGWRFDFGTLAASRVGAIYVRSYPRDASIYLDGKPVKNTTWFLANGTFINNLFPKNYTLRLAHDGYQDWAESREVKPTLVAEAKYAVLVPEHDAPFFAASGTIDRFQLLNGEGPVVASGGKLFLKTIPLPGTDILGATADFRQVLLWDAARSAYFLEDVSRATSTNLTSLLRRQGLRGPFEIILDKEDSTRLVAKESAGIFLYSTADQTLSRNLSLNAFPVSAAAASRSYLAWSEWSSSSGTSRINFFDLVLNSRLPSTASLPGKTVKMEIVKNSQAAILQDTGAFYLLGAGDGEPQKIASDVTDFAFTADASKVAALEHAGIEVFSFSQPDEYAKFRLPDTGDVRALSWYGDREHLFVYYPDAVRFLDLEDRALQNFQLVAATSQAQYDRDANTLYFIKNGKIFALPFPS